MWKKWLTDKCVEFSRKLGFETGLWPALLGRQDYDYVHDGNMVSLTLHVSFFAVCVELWQIR